MAISDYSTLAAEIKAWCARSDSVFSARIPTFVSMAEDRIYNGYGREVDPAYSPPLRSKAIEETGEITLVDGEAELPASAIGVRKIYRDGDRDNGLTFMPPERFEIELADSGAGIPCFYTIEKRTIRVAPAYDGVLSLLYHQRFPELTVSAPSNALLLAHPNIYLEACLYEAFSFTQAVELAVAHATRCRSLIQGVNATATAMRYAGPLRKRLRSPIG